MTPGSLTNHTTSQRDKSSQLPELSAGHRIRVSYHRSKGFKSRDKS
jgi:hypothetical protein